MNFEDYYLKGAGPYPLQDYEQEAVDSYKAIVNVQGPIWDDKFLIKGQVGVGILNHYLAPEQSFIVTGRVFSKRLTKAGYILHIGDATGTMFLLSPPATVVGAEAPARAAEIARLVRRGDLITAHVHTVDKPGRKPPVLVNDMYCVGMTFHSPQHKYVTRAQVDECMLRAVTYKVVRTFLNQQGFLEIPNDSQSPQRDHNSRFLMLGFPKIFTIRDNHLMVNAYHSDAEDMRRLLSLMLNSIQVGTNIRIWPPQLPILSVKEGKRKKEPRWLNEIPAIETPTWRNLHAAKEGPEFQHKFELRVAGKLLGTAEENTISLLEYTKHEKVGVYNPSYRHTGYLYEGLTPFATMTFELDDFVKCLTESPRLLYNQEEE